MVKSLIVFILNIFKSRTQIELDNVFKKLFQKIISMDFFTVPTINFKLLHVLVMIENHRRRIIHFNVTENPTSIWSV